MYVYNNIQTLRSIGYTYNSFLDFEEKPIQKFIYTKIVLLNNILCLRLKFIQILYFNYKKKIGVKLKTRTEIYKNTIVYINLSMHHICIGNSLIWIEVQYIRQPYSYYKKNTFIPIYQDKTIY